MLDWRLSGPYCSCSSCAICPCSLPFILIRKVTREMASSTRELTDLSPTQCPLRQAAACAMLAPQWVHLRSAPA